MNGKQKVDLELRNAHKFSHVSTLTTKFKFVQREGVFNFYISSLETTPSFKNNVAKESYLGEMLIVSL